MTDGMLHRPGAALVRHPMSVTPFLVVMMEFVAQIRTFL